MISWPVSRSPKWTMDSAAFRRLKSETAGLRAMSSSTAKPRSRSPHSMSAAAACWRLNGSDAASLAISRSTRTPVFRFTHFEQRLGGGQPADWVGAPAGQPVQHRQSGRWIAELYKQFGCLGPVPRRSAPAPGDASQDREPGPAFIRSAIGHPAFSVAPHHVDPVVSRRRQARTSTGDDVRVDIDRCNVAGFADQLGDQRGVVTTRTNLHDPHTRFQLCLFQHHRLNMHSDSELIATPRSFRFVTMA